MMWMYSMVQIISQQKKNKINSLLNMHSQLSLVITSLTSPSLLVKTRSSSTSLLISSSTTYIRKLSSTHYRNCLHLVCLAVLLIQQISGWFKYPIRTSARIMRLLPALCRRPHQLPPPNEEYTRTTVSPMLDNPLILTCNLSTCSSSSPGGAQYILVSLSHKEQLQPLTSSACLPKRT